MSATRALISYVTIAAAIAAILEGAVASVPLFVLFVVVRALLLTTFRSALLQQSIEALVVTLGALGALHLTSIYLMDRGISETLDTLRFAALDHLRREDASSHVDDSSTLIATLGRDLSNGQLSLVSSVPRLLRLAGEVMVIVSYVLLLDLRLAALLFIGLPIAVPCALLYVRNRNAGARALSNARTELAARLTEYVEGLEVLRAFGQLGTRFNRVVAAASAVRRRALQFETAATPLLAAYWLAIETGFGALIAGGTILSLHRALGFETFLAFLIFAPRLFLALRDVVEPLAAARIGLKAVGRAVAITALPVLPTGRRRLTRRSFDVEMRDASFSYGDRVALDRVSCSFAAGTVTAIVGRSGAGKSTLAALLARTLPARGEILFDSIPIAELAPGELAQNVALVAQDVTLMRATIAENIALGRYTATRAEIESVARAAHIHDFVQSLPNGYDTLVDDRGASLSGGERARITIARALLLDAPFVILDEATANIDAENERLIFAAIDELTRDKTVIVIGHVLSRIRSANAILVLDHGRVAECGTHAELLARGGTYATLWHEQNARPAWRLGSTPC